MAQNLVPSADDTDGAWTNQVDSATDLFQSVNEDVGAISDVDYIQSADPPSADTVRMKLANGTRPASGTARLKLRGRWAPGPPPATTEVSFVWAAVELAKEMGSHMDVNAVVTLNDDQVLSGKLGELASLNVKRVLNWSRLIRTGKSKGDPYAIMDLQEIKTTWHPVGM